MDRETVEKVEELIQETVEEHDLEVERVIIFGSRVRDDFTASSDVDLLIVSEDFEDVVWNERSGPFYEEWDYENLASPEFICLTPQEFEEKKDRKPHIVRTAVEEGIEIA